MAIQNKAKKEEKKLVNYDVKVTRVNQIKPGRYIFSADVNGVIINNFIYQEYTNSKGDEGSVINMPQYKGKDDKYFNVCFFPIAKELKASIGEQIEELLNE